MPPTAEEGNALVKYEQVGESLDHERRDGE
jgi:hypothetical protein